MKKIFGLLCVLFFIGTSSNLLAMEQSSGELEYKNSVKQKTLEYHRSHTPIGFLPELYSPWTAGGAALGVADVGTACGLILPPVLNCIPSSASTACFLAELLGGVLGGYGFVASAAGSVVFVGFRYHEVNKHNKKHAKRLELLQVIETAFNYDDNGLMKLTPIDTSDSEQAILIEDPNNDLLLRMITNYHERNPAYSISKTELAKRIRAAVYAGYFAPAENLAIKDANIDFGKWADLNIDELMTNLAIREQDLKTYYENAERDLQSLYKYNENVMKALANIDGGVIELQDS